MKYNLAGKWQFALDGEKAGIAQEFFKKTSFDDTIDLPTTTAEAQKGERGTKRYTGYLTETYSFEGYAWYLREVEIPAETQEDGFGRRFFFSMERTRKSTVWVDGRCAGSFDSFYAAHRYELTQWLTPGRHTLVVMTDNTDYVSNGGHMTSPDTQTNWNGILGEIYLESTVDIAVEKMWIYPSRKNKLVDIRLLLSGYHTVSDSARSEIWADVGCRLTRLRMKAGRDFEHFAPLGTQTAETRREWMAQGKVQDLPYHIETLEVFPERRCEIRPLESKETERADNRDLRCTCMGVRYVFEDSVKEWDEYNPYVFELTV